MANPNRALRLQRNLLRLRRRPQAEPWDGEGDFPWADAVFGRRVLREHLDESHAAASRAEPERKAQVSWIVRELGLERGQRVLDAACGPGLYLDALERHGLRTVAYDINLVAITEADRRAKGCTTASCFVGDLRHSALAPRFDAALLLYGQLAPFSPPDAHLVIEGLAHALRPGGQLVLELLDPDQVDRADDSWWFLDDTGVWGDAPFLHLGERRWSLEQNASIESYSIVHLESGRIDRYQLCDQSYTAQSLGALLEAHGLELLSAERNAAGVELYDAEEWVLYRARKR